MPNGQETRHRRQFAGSYRLVYNKALAINAQRYERNEKRLGYAELCALLPGWKREQAFLSDVPAAGIAASVEEPRTGIHQLLSKAPTFRSSGRRPAGEFP
jgi:putative transposase